MQKLVFGALFSLFPFWKVIAQDNQDGLRDKSITLGLTYGVDYGGGFYRTKDPQFYQQRDSLNKVIATAIGYRFALTFLKQTGYKTIMEAGIQNTHKLHRTDKQILPANPSFPDDPIERIDIYRYSYLEFPVGLHYILVDHRVKLTLTGGLSPGILLSSRREELFRTKEIRRQKGGQSRHRFPEDSPFGLDAFAGIGLTYDITGNLSLRLQPIYRQSLLTIAEGPVKKYLQAGSVQLSAFYLIER